MTRTQGPLEVIRQKRWRQTTCYSAIRNAAGFVMVNGCGPGGRPEEADANIEHFAACWNAVEVIGGDPGQVAALAGALRDLVESRKVKMGPSAVTLRFEIAAAIVDALPEGTA